MLQWIPLFFLPPKIGFYNLLVTSPEIIYIYVQWLLVLTNRSGPGQLFVKPGYSLNQNFFMK